MDKVIQFLGSTLYCNIFLAVYEDRQDKFLGNGAFLLFPSSIGQAVVDGPWGTVCSGCRRGLHVKLDISLPKLLYYLSRSNGSLTGINRPYTFKLTASHLGGI